MFYIVGTISQEGKDKDNQCFEQVWRMPMIVCFVSTYNYYWLGTVQLENYCDTLLRLRYFSLFYKKLHSHTGEGCVLVQTNYINFCYEYPCEDIWLNEENRYSKNNCRGCFVIVWKLFIKRHKPTCKSVIIFLSWNEDDGVRWIGIVGICPPLCSK